MLEARSVAVVGASVKEGSLGQQMLLELARGGYEGDVYPVNPGYDEVGGLRCYPRSPTCPVPSTSRSSAWRTRGWSRRCATPEAGVASAVTFSSLFEEEPPEAGCRRLGERVRRSPASTGWRCSAATGWGS